MFGWQHVVVDPSSWKTIFNKSFIATVCRACNSLPDSIKKLQNWARFNSALEKLFLNRMTTAAGTDGVDMGVNGRNE
ncbi:hypothetical protein J6590_101635 [Homalodisca vitripennis]|nr:hypothetical protein J6590_101635 [Homalodisca vitripennis]